MHFTHDQLPILCSFCIDTFSMKLISTTLSLQFFPHSCPIPLIFLFNLFFLTIIYIYIYQLTFMLSSFWIPSSISSIYTAKQLYISAMGPTCRGLSIAVGELGNMIKRLSLNELNNFLQYQRGAGRVEWWRMKAIQ